MVFHEITRPAIERALTQTRDIDDCLVDAQETRRILDRLYGYEVSPVLWRKIMQGLSAGRVQSVATRLVVERERERMRFVAAGYWDIVATFEPGVMFNVIVTDPDSAGEVALAEIVQAVAGYTDYDVDSGVLTLGTTDCTLDTLPGSLFAGTAA